VADFAFRALGFPQLALGLAQGDRSSISGVVSRAYRWPLRHLRDRVAPLALARMVPDSLEHPSVPALRRCEAFARAFTGPAEIVWGMRDPVIGRALKRVESILPSAPVTRTQAGHFLQEEVPEEIAAAVMRVASTCFQ
jgi:haloalkane dehalogenase